jgi:lysophospholipase L1-like esterase
VTRRLGVALVGALLLAIAVTSGATPGAATTGERAGRAFPPTRPTRVLVLGDSVMKGAADRYAAALPGREVVVDAEVNRSTGQGAEVLARLGTDWDVVVVLLGHNDGGSPGAFQPAARRILDQLRDVRVVSWLTIHEVRDYYPGVNQYVAGLQADYPNLIVGDWNAIAAANPGGLAGDGLHLNGSGASLLADLVADQVEIAEMDWALALRALAQATSTTTTTTTAPTTTTTSTTTTTTTAPTTTTTLAATTTSAAASLDRAADCDPERDGPCPSTAVAVGDGGGTDTDDRERNVLLAGSVVIWAAVAVWGVGRMRARRARAAGGRASADPTAGPPDG